MRFDVGIVTEFSGIEAEVEDVIWVKINGGVDIVRK